MIGANYWSVAASSVQSLYCDLCATPWWWSSVLLKLCGEMLQVYDMNDSIITGNGIVHMMMSTRQTNIAHHVHYVVAIITPPNIVLRESMTLMTSWRK